MNIAISSNEKYLKYAMVMMSSLCVNNPVHIDLFLLNASISEEKIKEFRQALSMYDLTIHNINSFDGEDFALCPTNENWTVEMYFRLKLPWLEEVRVERILYLDVDVIVTSTGAPHYVVKQWETQQLMARRKGRPLFFIDIAVPRDVEPETGEIRGVTLYNIDDLEAVVDCHKQERESEALLAHQIIEEELYAILERFKYLSFRPIMALLSDRAERIRAREIKRAASKLPDLEPEEWRAVDHMTKMIVRKLLRIPMMKLNASAGTEQEQFYIEAMRSLFRLDTLGETGRSEEEHYHYRYAQQ